MFLGIDIGTSAVKAAVIDERGLLAGQASHPLAVDRPRPLWSEQDPESWWLAVDAAVLSLPSEIRKKLRGIGLAGQMHGATLLDANDRPLRPAILWNDGRSFDACVALERMVPQSRVITGNLAMPGFTAPKLLWVKEHEPDIFQAVKTVLLPKDYVRLKMTGEKASDLSDSAGTLWLDVAARNWSQQMLAACGLGIDAMPRLYEGTEVTGVLRPDIAARWGMERIPVAAGAGDNAAGAAGVGVIGEGQGLLSLGTSGVIFAATGAFRPNPDRAVHAFCHCFPSTWHVMSVNLSAASCITWASRLLGVAGEAAVFDLAAQVIPFSGRELFLPYLSGERTPHNDPYLRGGFLNLDHDSDPNRIASAVLEGIAFAHADGLDALRQAGTTVEELWTIGGGARSRAWGQILASVLGVRLVYGADSEVGPALGAARLGMIAAVGASPAEVCKPPAIAAIIEPDKRWAEALARKRNIFTAAYQAAAPLGRME